MPIYLRKRKLYNNRFSYYLDIYYDGKRHYEKTYVYVNPSDTKERKRELKQLAETIRSMKELEIVSGQYNIVASHKKRMKFYQFYQKFIDQYLNKDKRLVRYSFEKFRDYMGKRGESLQVSQLNASICEGYAKYLKSEACGLRGETPYNYWCKFTKVIRQAQKDGLINERPYEGIIVKRTKGILKKEVLTDEELAILANTDCGNEQVKFAFLLACYTGLGYAEFKKLTWGHIRNGRLKLERAKTKMEINNKLNSTCLALMGERGKPDELIFNLPSAVAVGKNLKRWIAKAGIDKNISFYCGRHTFATRLLIHGSNVKTVSDALGQASTEHTIKYLNYVESLKDKAIDNLPVIELSNNNLYVRNKRRI